MRSMLPVTEVTQRTGAMCSLACLESVARDLGLDWTQEKIAVTFRYEAYADRQDEQPIGAVTVRHLPSIVLGMGLAQELRCGTGSDSLEELAPVLE